MRHLFFFLFLGFWGTAFGQLERHGYSRPWEVFAGYQLPIGKWAEPVDFEASERPVYYGSFSGMTGQHARMGFHAGICYTRTSVGKSGFAKNFQVLFYPAIFSAVFYDLESNGPAIANSKIKPWMQFEAAVAPCYALNIGGNTLKFLARFGVAAQHTAGEVHFEPVNPTAYLDKVKYSYTGVRVCVGPGVKFVTGRVGIGAELQMGFTMGRYRGEGNHINYGGNVTGQWTDIFPNRSFGSRLLSFSVGYAFGG